jgi:hypothetical protein
MIAFVAALTLLSTEPAEATAADESSTPGRYAGALGGAFIGSALTSFVAAYAGIKLGELQRSHGVVRPSYEPNWSLAGGVFVAWAAGSLAFTPLTTWLGQKIASGGSSYASALLGGVAGLAVAAGTGAAGYQLLYNGSVELVVLPGLAVATDTQRHTVRAWRWR